MTWTTAAKSSRTILILSPIIIEMENGCISNVTTFAEGKHQFFTEP